MDEFHYVGTLAAHGAYAHASDWSMNMQVLANLPEHAVALSSSAATTVATSPVPADDANVHTVAFVMSDGDNVCWLQSGWLGESWYGAPSRGAVPMGWTYAPAAATEVLPLAYQWATSNATANDTFMAGPSGAGYTYPDMFSDDRSFADATAGKCQPLPTTPPPPHHPSHPPNPQR